MLKWANEIGVDVLNDTNAVGDTSMTMAVFSGHLHIMEYLDGLGVDTCRRSNNGFSLVMIAAENDRLEALQWLTRDQCIHGVDLRWNSPIILAANSNHLRIVEYLIEKGALLNDGDDCGCTPIYLAAQHGNLDMVKLLHTHGANLFDRDNDNVSVGEVAAQSGKIDCLRYILDHGVPVTSAIVKGAVLSGCVEMVKMLEPVPVEIDFKLLAEIAKLGHLDMLKYLETKYSIPSRPETEKRKKWQSIFVEAISNKHLPIAEYIMQKHGVIIENCSLELCFPKLIETPEVFDWVAARIPNFTKLIIAQDPHCLIASGEQGIKWLLNNGWEGQPQDSYLNPYNWPDAPSNYMSTVLPVLVKHLGWTAQDLSRTFEHPQNPGESISPLIFAICGGQHALAKYLVDVIGVPFPNEDIETKCLVLGSALRGTDAGMVKWVLERLKMPLPNIFAPKSRTVVMSRHLSIMQDLAESELPVTCPEYQKEMGRQFSARGYAEDDQEENSEEEEEEEERNTFLDDLLESGDSEVFAWCYEQCEVYGLSKYSPTVGSLIFSGDSVTRLAWFLDAASAEYPNLSTLMVDAAVHDAWECIKYLFTKGGSLGKGDDLDWPLIAYCIGSRTIHTFSSLLDYGVLDIHRKYSGCTLMQHCIVRDCYQAFIELVMRGASIIEPTIEGVSPIHLAQRHSPSILEWYLECGFSIS